MIEAIIHPKHYNKYRGFEVIDIVEQLNFCQGNAVKYILRSDFKHNKIQDLEKAIWYIKREIKNIQKYENKPTI